MHNFVYRWPFFFWLSLLLAFAGLLAVKSVKSSSQEGDQLHEIIDSAPRNIRKQQRKEHRELTHQTRNEVTKEIIVVDGPLRRVVELTSESSDIQVVSKRPHMRVVETFYNVKGTVQNELFYLLPDGKEVVYGDDNKLYYRNKKPLEEGYDLSKLTPKQHFRYFEAVKASYDFHTNQLLAYDVKFWNFTAYGHHKVEDPLALEANAEGEAARLAFYVSRNNAKNEFSAEFLKVQFTPEGGI